MKSTLFAIFRPALLLAAGLCLLSCTKEEGEALLTGTDPVCFESYNPGIAVTIPV